jgi:hypothetical protein
MFLDALFRGKFRHLRIECRGRFEQRQLPGVENHFDAASGILLRVRWRVRRLYPDFGRSGLRRIEANKAGMRLSPPLPLMIASPSPDQLRTSP